MLVNFRFRQPPDSCILTPQVDVSRGNIDLEMAPMPMPPREDPPQPQGRTFLEPQQSSSILSLTLGELQLKSGRSLGSMNMDDFIASIWSVDEAASSALPSSENDLPEDQLKPVAETGQDGALLRQNSFVIPSPLCKKTVDEVWSEIQIKYQKDKQVQNDLETGIPEDHHDELSRPQPLGETTLEDFLAKSGVAQGSAMPSSSRPNSFAPRHLEPALGLISNGHSSGKNIPGVSSMNYPMILGNYCNSCTVESSPNIFNEKTLERLGLKRRINEGQVELMGDRRHRRMIKNRESAARSRARKQAYTAELEVELNQLREENEKLKKITAEIDELQKELARKRNRNGLGKLANRLKSIRRTVSME